MTVYGHLASDGAEGDSGRVLSGPCQAWTDADAIRATADFDTEIKADFDLAPMAAFATVTLWRLTGKNRRFMGLCRKVYRPDERGCPPRPNRAAVELPDGPVYDVVSVVIEGVELDAGSYRLAGYRDLVRVDGEAWPAVQNMERDSTVPGDGDDASRVDTWQVTYRVGAEIQEDARLAASIFAAELALARNGSTKCRLPQRYWQKRIDPMTFIKDGKTGIPEVDVWLQSVNPGGISSRAKLIDPRAVARRSKRDAWA